MESKRYICTNSPGLIWIYTFEEKSPNVGAKTMPFYVLQSSLAFPSALLCQTSGYISIFLVYHFLLFLGFFFCLTTPLACFQKLMETWLVIEANIWSGGVTRGGLSFYDFASKNIRYIFFPASESNPWSIKIIKWLNFLIWAKLFFLI